jgi:type VI secretion system protein ImpC
MAAEDTQAPRSKKPPQVTITYDLEVGDAIERRELPFVVGVLADLSGHPAQPLPRLSARRFIEVTKDNFDKVLAAIGPRLTLTVQNRLLTPGTLQVELLFRNIDDFGPDRVAEQIEPLQKLLALRQELTKHLDVRPEADLRENAIGSTLASEPLTDSGPRPEHAQTATAPRVAQIDELVSAQLNDILHSHEFQCLEAAWSGLRYFVFQTETSPRLKIRVLNVSKQELMRDFTRVTDFDQTCLFKKVSEEEYGTLGGEPYGVLVGDYEFGPGSEDMESLETMAKIAATAQAPFIAAASPGMFFFDAFTELSSPRSLHKIFDAEVYNRWNKFRESEEARFTALVLPRVLLRLPFGKETQPARSFEYEEGVDGTDHNKYLWGSAAYALGARLTSAFAKCGWCAAICGVEGGGLVQNLAVHAFMTDQGDVAVKCPTETAITDSRYTELCNLGFLPILYYKGTDLATFLSAPSCYKPEEYPSLEENANERLGAQLMYTIAAARFAHYLRCIRRDSIGRIQSKETCQASLNTWISHYVLSQDAEGTDLNAQFPLREARVELEEGPGNTSGYIATLHVRPHFQLPKLTGPLRLTFALPK